MPVVIPSRLLVPVSIIVALAALAGCTNSGGGAATGKSSTTTMPSTAAAQTPSAVASTPRAAQAASALLDSAVKAMLAQKSVHLACTMSGSTGDQVQSQDAGVASGHTVTTDGDVSISSLFVDGVVYINTNTAAVLANNDIPETEAESLAGDWISIRPGQSYGNEYLSYAAGIRGMTLADQADALLATGPLTRTGSMVVQGVPVYGVSGDATTYYSVFTTAVKGSTETVYIAASGAPLPVSVSAHSSKGIETTCNFSNWNKPLGLTAPADAVPVTSIPAN
jgi:hypothetical protein